MPDVPFWINKVLKKTAKKEFLEDIRVKLMELDLSR
jgi:hypothetical protein